MPDVKLWHDDIRRPPDGSWTWARTNAEAMSILYMNEVTECSLDHDLGLHELDPDDFERPEILRGHSPNGDGRNLCLWMVGTGKIPPKVTIHSWNPDGAMEMARILDEAHVAEIVIKPYEVPPPAGSLVPETEEGR